MALSAVLAAGSAYADEGPDSAMVEVIEGAPSGLVGAIVIPAAALFEFDKADLSDEGKAAIEEHRKQLHPELSEAYAGIVIGHTDSTGDTNYNLGLSSRRAENRRVEVLVLGRVK